MSASGSPVRYNSYEPRLRSAYQPFGIWSNLGRRGRGRGNFGLAEAVCGHALHSLPSVGRAAFKDHVWVTSGDDGPFVCFGHAHTSVCNRSSLPEKPAVAKQVLPWGEGKTCNEGHTHSYWASSSSGEGLELQFSMERQSPELLYVHVAWFSTSTSGSP